MIDHKCDLRDYRLPKSKYSLMAGHLVNKDIDWLIAKQLLRDGRPRAMRSINLLLIIFGPLTAFAKICSTRYQQLMCRYRQVKSINDLVPAQVHNNSFWHTAIKNFTTAKPGDRIVFDGGQKGTTRQRLYMLGTLFGCRWSVTGQERRENRYGRHGRIVYKEDKIDFNKLYTMKELCRLRIDFPNMWMGTDQTDDNGEVLYAPADSNEENGYWDRRGVMCNGPGIITFTKL